MRTDAERIVTAALMVAGLAFVPVGADQTTGPKLPPLAIESMYGPDLFKMYCASCHGRDGKGNGPVAAALKVPPPDLTVLSRRQNGVFPEQEVEAIITGPVAVRAHGSDEMPVWGAIFRALDSNDTRAKARIKNLVAHIRSIQLR
jgi:mono/diheme cytochrome c family protein